MSTVNNVGEVKVIDETKSAEALRELAASSFEAKLILDNFAARKRIHRDALLMIRVFYSMFIKQGLPVKKSSFDSVFFKLEELGYGLTEKSPSGDLKAFLPEVSLKYIGMTAQPIAKIIKTQAVRPVPPTIKTVVITFDVNGKKCQAEVPLDQVAQFTAMLSS